MKTVGDLSDGVAGLLTGTNLNNVTNLYGAYQRAARTLAQQADIPESTGRQTYNLYDGVYDYLAPTYVFGGAINDLRPQGVSRSQLDYVYKKPILDFDITKAILPNGCNVTFEWKKGVPIMRVAQTKAQPMILLDSMDLTTGWTAGGSASGLVVDGTVYYQSPASLRFTCTGASTGTLTKTLTTPIDLTTYQGVGVVFLAIDTPSATNLTSITLKIGSDSSNYYSVTSTQGFLGAWQANDFSTLVPFDLSTATTTGTPTITAMDYIQISFAHSATLTNMRTGYLFISLPSPYELLYQSTAIFLVKGTLSNDITDDNDQIVLGDAAYNIYEYECARAVILQTGGSFAKGLGAEYTNVLHNKDTGLYPKYRSDNPSEEIREVGSWYD